MKLVKIYETNNAIVLGFLVYGFIFNQAWCYYIAITVLISSIYSEYSAYKIAQLWTQIGKILGYVNSNIILGLFFFLLLTPFSLIIRLFIKKKNSFKTSSWETNKYSIDFTKPF